jgi:integrase
MAGVHAQHGRLLVSFQYACQGRRWRCREFLGLDDTRDNRRLAARLALQLERELAAGSFDYAARFPASRNLTRMGLAARSRRLPLLADYAAQWLDAQRAHLRPATWYDYGLIVRKHIAPPPLGPRALEQVTRRDVESWINGLRAAGVGPRRVNMALARLRTIFRLAEEEELIAGNPLRLVRGLREPRMVIDPFDTAETGRLIAAAPAGPVRALLAVLLWAGLRPSEALGLQWGDIDLGRGLISVRRSRGRFGAAMTKTAASERDVDIGPRLVAELRALARQQGMHGWLFVGARGAALDWTNFRQRQWPRILATASVRARPPYHCRHTYAATLLAAGANPQYVAHQLGHASLAMVIRHYARWSRKPQAGVLLAAGL